MDVFAQIETRVAAALEALKAEGALPADVPTSGIEVETPRDPTHGDLATNAAMVLAKPARMKPRDIADKLQAKLAGAEGVEAVSVAGPGFLNLTLKPEVWHGLVRAILDAGRRLRALDVGNGKTVNVEYVSANPTGPMHVGHCRGAVFGDVLANLLAFAGFDVTREYYVNDAGGQVDVLARSVFLRYREALGEDIGDIPQGLYPGDYLKPVGEALAKEHGPSLLNMPEDRWLPIVRTFAIDADDADDQGRPRGAQHQARRVLLRSLADERRHRQDQGGDRGTARQGPHLRGPAREARRATRTRSGRTASRRCSSRPNSATRPIAR